MQIEWTPTKDRHIEGETPFGKVFIRLNKENVVTGIYTLFEKTEKYVPEKDFNDKVDTAKMYLEELCDVEKTSRELSVKLRKDEVV